MKMGLRLHIEATILDRRDAGHELFGLSTNWARVAVVSAQDAAPQVEGFLVLAGKLGTGVVWWPSLSG
jgi:hypothetical protein